MRIQDEAVVLRRIPFRESSLIIHFCTGQHGVLAALAKGIRAGKGGERAALAGWHTLRIQGQAREWGALATLTGVEIATPRCRLLTDPTAAAAGEVLREAIYRHAPPADPQPALFKLLDTTLDHLEAGDSPLPCLARAMAELLSLLGYGWRMDRCAGCGASELPAFLSPRLGQGVCARCGEPHAHRLISLSPALAVSMGQVASSQGMGLLSVQETVELYRLAVVALERHGGQRPLAADSTFRLLLASGAGSEDS